MEHSSDLSPASLVVLGLVFVLEVVVCTVIARAIWRRQPRSVEGWAREAAQISLRVPATGALYAAGVLAFLWIRAHV